MSVQDCMKYAVSTSTKMRIQQAAKSDARIARRDAVLAIFTPQVQAQTYAYYNFGRSIDPQTNTYFNTTSFHNNYGVDAGLDLFNGFQAVNNYRISRTSLLIADSQQKQAEETAQEIKEVYLRSGYVIDTHTAVASKVCRKYREETKDTTPVVIASTASPYKFARAVVCAIEPEMAEKTDSDLIDELQKLSGVRIPEAIEDIRKAPILHNTFIAGDGMEKEVASWLGLS